MKKNITLFSWFFIQLFLYFDDDYELHDDAKEKFGEYISEEDMTGKKQLLRDMPGPTGLKYAYYIGGRVNGMSGIISAILGILMPVPIITVIIILFERVIMRNDNLHPTVVSVFGGIFNGMTSVALGLIISSVFKITQYNKINRKALLIIVPFSLAFVFFGPAQESLNPLSLNIIFLAIVIISGLICAILHIRYEKQKIQRESDPDYKPDLYSKKAIRERDRKLFEEEEAMKNKNRYE